MTQLPIMNSADECFLPGSLNDSRLFHTDEADFIQVCSPHVGQGYRQIISLQDDVTLVIIDHTLNQPRVIDRPGRGNCLEFEFRLAGPDAGYSSFIPYFGLKEFWTKPAQKRYFNIEVWLKRPALITYFQAFLERLSPQTQGTAERIIQLIYRRHGGGSRSTPMGMLDQIFDRAKEVGPHSTFEQVLTDALYDRALALNDSARSPITPVMEQVIGQILSCPYQGATRRIYLERQALKLVGLYLEAIVQQQSQETALDYVYQAGAILRNQLANPPTIEALARQVGTNRFYLYRGFQQVYGTTPFGYLRDCRLWQARRLLMTAELSVCQVATAVGYTSRSNFALAFRQQVGLNPKTFQTEAWQRAI